MTENRTLLRPRWLHIGGGAAVESRAVLVEDGRILDVVDAGAAIDANVIDLPNQVLLPGFVNSHTHVGAGPIARGVGEDWDLPTGTPYYMPLTQLWTLAYRPDFREQYRAIVRWDTIAMLTTGTTTIVNQASIDVEGYLDVAAELGVRTWAGPSLPMSVEHRLGEMGRDRVARRNNLTSPDEQVDELAGFRDLYERWQGAQRDRIRMLLGPASAHTVDYDVLVAVGKLAEELDCPVTVHLCQAPSELEETRRRYGLTPPRVLDQVGLLDQRVICAHGTYTPAEDMKLLASSGASVAHCAVRKAREARFTPFLEFLDAGVRTVIGTDAFTTDLVTEIRIAATLAKVSSGQTHRPGVGQVVDAATSSAGDALGRSDLGRIMPGAVADLVGVRLGGPENWPVFDPVRAVAYYSTGADVDFVMVDGVVRKRDGDLLDLDVRAAGAAAETACTELWDRARASGVLDFDGDDPT